ncbi:MAG: ribonuclease HII [Clostridia bacterium]|nr:ribonuclease HII [Clostridia bacterium]
MNWDIYREIVPENSCMAAGLDEAGRGPLFGAVYAAAVILPDGYEIEGLDDSKKITEKKREKLFDIIIRDAISYGIGVCEPFEIDQINILNASLLAMRRAVENMSVKPDFLLVDGNIYRDFDIDGKAVVGGDGKIPSIAAASILAKVSRDRYCLEMDRKYPQYGLAKHKGYPTKAHYGAIMEHGPTPLHRISFLKKLYGEK